MGFDQDPGEQANISCADLAIMCDEIVSLKAQVASLRKDIQDADDLLSKGDNHGALAQVRMAASRASDSYLDCIGRSAIAKVTDRELLTAQSKLMALRHAMLNVANACRIWGGEAERARGMLEHYLATPDDTAELDALIADAARLDALEFHLFEHQWNGVVGSGAQTYWRLAGNYRHTLHHMVGETFREAIDAMKEATP